MYLFTNIKCFQIISDGNTYLVLLLVQVVLWDARNKAEQQKLHKPIGLNILNTTDPQNHPKNNL